MKTKIVMLLVVLAVVTAPFVRAETPPDSSAITVRLTRSAATENTMLIWLTPDGYSYVIDSAAPLEGGEPACQLAPENPNELVCDAPMVAGFEVHAGPREDKIVVTRAVQVPVTIRGGRGSDLLFGGGGSDLLVGGPGEDRLGGRAGDDLIFGGPGSDLLLGGPGDDVLRGGPGRDESRDGPGMDVIYIEHDAVPMR
ncbi:MAG TPA: hypothetical protein VID51_04415 [Solirubrobacterales bacterium]|jgi:hypothetical protein